MTSRILLAFCFIAATSAIAAQRHQDSSTGGRATQSSRASTSGSSVSMAIPVRGWSMDVLAGINDIKSQAGVTGKVQTKAGTDAATVFRPLPPCRLVDTRGYPAWVNIGTAFNPGDRRNVSAGGRCGIPLTFVKGISLNITTFNHTPGTGGYIAILPPGGGVNATASVFNNNPPTEWQAFAYNILTPSDPASFDVLVTTATADVVIDVNGYYQDMDSVDVGSQELDFSGSSLGDLFEITQNGTGSALSAGAFGAGAKALTLYGGSIRIAGAGAGTATPVFIHQSAGTQCGTSSQYSMMTHPMLDNDPNALVLVTPRAGSSAGSFEIEYAPASCAPAAAGKWTIHDKSGAAITGDFNVLVFKN